MKMPNKISTIIAILLFALTGMAAQAFSETCICDSPCSGSRTCPDGCWAFCEERASGPYCAKGCVYDRTGMTSSDKGTQRKLNAIDIKLPKEQVKPLLEQLFGVTLVASPTAPKQEKSLIVTVASTTDHVVVNLKNVDLKGILDELKDQGITLQIK